MKALVLTFDSLNRHMLSPYGGNLVPTPNFARLAERTVTFDNCYVGSMPCMPARREMHTGRYNFLHCGWGCLEPYDFSMPRALDEAGVYTHHATDHYHYWEDGGHHYMQRYSSHEMFRGQEGDLWIPRVEPPRDLPELIPGRGWNRSSLQDEVNRRFGVVNEQDWPMDLTVTAGLRFLEGNAQADDWLLHIETFDPHEPFYAPQRFRDRVKHDYVSGRADWPPYGRTDFFGYDEATVRQIRAEYLALLAFCDYQLGRILDAMDWHNLWEETLLIVNADHGFLLGEKGMLAKSVVPLYNEVAQTPLFIWDPRAGKAGERREALVQTIDLVPTVLDYFGQPIPETVRGHALREVLEGREQVREAGLFGLHGGGLNVVSADGYLYMLAPEEEAPLYAYTIAFAHMRGFHPAQALSRMQLDRTYDFSQDIPLLCVPAQARRAESGEGPHTQLFDVKADPQQEKPYRDADKEREMAAKATALMRAHDAPDTIYAYYGLAGE